MALIKFQYENGTQKQTLLEENKHLYLCEQQNLFEGDFLIFSEEPLEIMKVYTDVPEEEFNRLKSRQESTEEAISFLLGL